MRKLLGLILLLTSGSASAQSMFDIPLTDVSRIYLNTIFGTVGNVLSGTGSQLLKEAFSYFNSAVLVLGGIIIIYSLIVSTVNTSHDGEMLGKKWNSVWIPLRSAAGFGLLLPVKAGGYAVIQVMVMYVVLQGVGAANYIWSKSLTYIGTGGGGFSKPVSSQAYSTMGQVFSNWVCAYAGADYVNQQYGRTNARASMSIQNYSILQQFTGSGKGTCGSVQLIDGSSGLETKDQMTNDAIINAVNQLAAPARAYVAGYPDEPNANSIIQMIRDVTTSYSAAETDIARQAAPESPSKFIQQATDVGWLFAGSYFLQIAKAVDRTAPDPYMFKVDPADTGKINNIFGTNNSIVPIINAAGEFAQNNVDPSGQSVSIKVNSPGFGKDLIYMIFSPAISAWEYYLRGEADKIDDYLAGNFKSNPIADLHSVGANIIYTIEVQWLVFGAAVVGTGALAFVNSCMLPFAYMAQTGLQIVMPLVTITAAVIFPTAGLLAYYVPLMPFIIFTMGAVGWFVLVIEAMAAAPVVALGILHPEGQHEVYGKAEPGIYLLINVFLRPPLMIMGLFAAYLLTFVAVATVNLAFFMLTGGIKGDFMPSIAGMTMLMSVYSLTLVTIMQKCFGLIHMLPDRVMRWIGQHDQYASAYGAEQDMQGFKQAAQGAGEQAGKGYEQSIGGTAGKLAEGLETAGQKKSEMEAKGKRYAKQAHEAGKGKGSVSSGESGGGGAGGGGGGAGGGGGDD